jgi:hypothetical protein
LQVFPFPVDARMGWGLDVLWTRFQQQGLRLGVVDATPMLHLGAVGVAYEGAYEYSALDAALAHVGVTGTEALTVNLGRPWRKWRRRPPWPPDADAA